MLFLMVMVIMWQYVALAIKILNKWYIYTNDGKFTACPDPHAMRPNIWRTEKEMLFYFSLMRG